MYAACVSRSGFQLVFEDGSVKETSFPPRAVARKLRAFRSLKQYRDVMGGEKKPAPPAASSLTQIAFLILTDADAWILNRATTLATEMYGGRVRADGNPEFTTTKVAWLVQQLELAHGEGETLVLEHGKLERIPLKVDPKVPSTRAFVEPSTYIECGEDITVRDVDAAYPAENEELERKRKLERYERARVRLPKRERGWTRGEIAQFLHQQPYEPPREWLAANSGAQFSTDLGREPVRDRIYRPGLSHAFWYSHE